MGLFPKGFYVDFYVQRDVRDGSVETKVLSARVFLTTKNEGFYLRECRLRIETGEMLGQMGCNPEEIRKTTGSREFLFFAEWKAI